MKQNIFILSIIIITIFFGCKNNQVKNLEINPLDELAQVDKMLSKIAEKPQHLVVPSHSETIVTGAKGTIIHVDPKTLETVDGSPLGAHIQIVLLEMTNNSSLLLNNAQTVSNGELLITGGAYYLNMTSDGKQLKMKQVKGLEVEFPKLTENEMGLFIGERDSLGKMNWVPTENNFKSKNIIDAEEPEKPATKKYTSTTHSDMDDLFAYMNRSSGDLLVEEEELSEEEYLKKKAAYEAAQKQIEYQRKTYEAVELMNFGWINCDRFFYDPSPKTEIQLLIKNDSITGARIYAIFKDINSIMTQEYWQGRKDIATFRNIPTGKQVTIIALTAKNETPFIFESTINTEKVKQVKIEFVATTDAEIKEILNRMN